MLCCGVCCAEKEALGDFVFFICVRAVVEETMQGFAFVMPRYEASQRIISLRFFLRRNDKKATSLAEDTTVNKIKKIP